MKSVWDGIKAVIGMAIAGVILGVGSYVAVVFMCGLTHGSCHEKHEMKWVCEKIGTCGDLTK